MPIDYKKYHAKWKIISKYIREIRANNCCEFCGVKNGSIIKVAATVTTLDLFDSELKNKKTQKQSKVVLTVAHLDHDVNNNHTSNLRALCQRCHLSYDAKHHADSRRFGRYYKERQLNLF